jgi:hypothetical protein
VTGERKRAGPNSRLRIVVLGYIVRGPLGGLAWHHLQYVLGLARLGHDVYFLEDSDDYPSCYDPSRDATGLDPSYGLEFAAKAFPGIGLADRWAYHDAHSTRWHGPAASRILEVCKNADLLLNLSGVNPLRPWLFEIEARALIDTDPVFTQISHLCDPGRRHLAEMHTVFFSFGENICTGRASVPDDGLPWQATRQPIVLGAWPVAAGPGNGRLTTVMQWDSYSAREYGGVRYGVKSDSFGGYLNLPEKAGSVFELAVGSPTTPRALLRGKGWALRNPLQVTRDPWTYQRYIRDSRAEFSVAKQAYVLSRSGWFSERSACYLASGRPVIVEETGMSDWLPTGEGVLTFSSTEQVLRGIDALNADYERHSSSARLVAEDYFAADRVLAALLEAAMS